MKSITPAGNDGAAPDMLRSAAANLERVLAAVERATNRIENEAEAPNADYEKLVRLYGHAVQSLLKEKQKIDESIRKEAGIVPGHALNFADAREEIRCRMARLRDAGSSGEFSE